MRTVASTRSTRDGFFSVAPGTGMKTNANAVKTLWAMIYTNVALTDDGDIWWEGLTDEPPGTLIDWKGRAGPLTPTSRAATRTHGSLRPAAQCPSIAGQLGGPAGVPISAILFDWPPRRTPLVNEGAGLGTESSSAPRCHRDDRRSRRRYGPVVS